MKKDFKKKVVLAVIVPCLILLALPFFVNNADEVLRAVTKIFAGEKSYVKTMLLLVYVAILGVTACLFVRHGKSGQKPVRKYGVFLAVSLAVSYLINLGSFLWFYIKYRFPLNEFVITMSGTDMSSTQFVHNHVMKGIVGTFAQFYKGGVYESVDAGVAFVGLLPQTLFIAGAVAFLATLGAFFLHFRQSLSEHLSTEKARPIMFIFLYGIASFVLLKNIIDGGLFDFAVLPSAFILFLLASRTRNVVAHNAFALGSLAYVAIVSAFAFITASDGSVAPLFYFYRSIVAFVVLFVMYFILHCRADRRLCVLLALGACSLLWYPIQSNLGVLKYEAAVVSPEDGAVVGSYAVPTGSSYVEMGRVGQLKFYKYTPESDTMISEVLRENSLVNNFYPVSIPWNTCVPMDNSLDYSFMVRSLDEINVVGSSLVTLLKMELRDVRDGLYSYDVSIRTNGCMPRGLDVIREFFSSQGARTFFIYDISTGQYVYDLQ